MLNPTERRSLALLRTYVRRLRLPVKLHRVGDELIIRLRAPISDRAEAELLHLVGHWCCRYHLERVAQYRKPLPVGADVIEAWIAGHPGDADGIRRACKTLRALPVRGKPTTERN